MNLQQLNKRADKSDFWDLNYYNHPPLTKDMVDLAEKLLNIKLPQLFIELLKVQNGGFTKGFAFPLEHKTEWAEGYIPLHELFGIVTNEYVWTAQNILDSVSMAMEWGLPGKQVLLAVADGPRYITLDYRSSDDPSVRWIDLNSNEDVRIADSFDAFFYGLITADKFVER